jgi:hypothetical protein
MKDDAKHILIVQRYFRESGIETTVIAPSMFPGKKKLPDLSGEFGKGGFFFAEVKSPKLVEDPAMGYAHHTMISKLLSMFRQACKQLGSANPTHLAPNLIVWVSTHFQLNWSNFVDAFRGYVGVNQSIIRDFRKSDFHARAKKDWPMVDIHIWLQVNKQEEVCEIKLFRLPQLSGPATTLFRILERHDTSVK